MKLTLLCAVFVIFVVTSANENQSNETEEGGKSKKMFL